MYVQVIHSVRDGSANFSGSLCVPSREYSQQEPTLHLQDSGQRMALFITVAETRELIDVLTGSLDALQDAVDEWAARTRTERDAEEAAAERPVAETVQP